MSRQAAKGMGESIFQSLGKNETTPYNCTLGEAPNIGGGAAGDPALYIILVLLFYSCWIFCLLVNSMVRQTTESEDYYSKYLEHSERGRFRGRPSGRLALQALNNAVNVIQFSDEKVTYV